MDSLLHSLLREAESNCDLKVKSLQLASDCLWLVYFESIVSCQDTIDFIWNSGIISSDSFNDICNRLMGKELYSEEMNELHNGKVVVLDSQGERAFSFQGKLLTLTREIEKPENEFMPFSSGIAFVESLTTNIGLLRNAIKAQFLVAEGYTFHGKATKKASLIYHSKQVDKELLHQIRSLLQEASGKDLQSGQDLIKILGCNRFNFFPPFFRTEVPMQAISSMMSGRVLLMIEGDPVAYVLPIIFSDFIALEWDKQLPILLMLGVRCIRLLSLVIALLAPGFYVALVSVNPEALRIELALSVASSRIGIPLPTFLEMLFLMTVSEIIIEATQRLPKVIAASVTVSGGIILGTAIVDAKLVSNLVIIIASVSGTASFAFPNYFNSLTIRIMRIGIIVLSAMFGLFGLFGGFIAICFYFCGIERFSVPFLSFLNSKKIGQS
ncbi:spore germination protein [Paenibacillus qinlingensis]|uniref:GerA spore germination protein n=1 Tax=Paenibacillus qinlingensis TaxID=1837343 RepID=A0ABU1NSA0_9BACL|nr:spore germination protein [Paenibacillus qinlingensis]MDR6550362.1 hypothetical protein [Paenibacillus qinlingensis]